MQAPLDLSSAVWRKSSYSNGQGGNCVEVCQLPGLVAVRDSKNPGGPALVVTSAAWASFVERVRGLHAS